MPHFDELGWIIQERKIVDIRGSTLTHIGNHPMLNCRGALNLDFKRRIYEVAVNHNPAIMVITETRVKEEADLPFDGFITTMTIGYTGGL